MRAIQLIRAALLLALSPLVGFWTLHYLLTHGQFAPWHAGLILGLIFGPGLVLDKVSVLGSRIERIGAALADDRPAREKT